MSLTGGTRLGPYEIVGLLGAGGMGEVYRARDTKLDRHVAIKVLPDVFVSDPERVARFKREAKTLASLNHPNIGGIYGLQEAEGATALVLELVEGPTLADRIALGPIPMDEALPFARQIADALEAAHEHGVVHRDLKPANIKLTPAGQVKVLDFGLAKAAEAVPAASGISISPTLTSPVATRAGMLLGTAAYMAPEQARGKPVDKRADIWAFGAVLYEMVTGKRAFEAEDVSLTLAEVMKGEPDWSVLPADVPPRVTAALKACLRKNPAERLHDIADVRLLLEGAIAPAEAPSSGAARSIWRSAIPIGVSALVFAIAGALATWSFTRPAPLPVLRSVFTLPEGQAFTNAGRQVVAISPDGKRMAYVANARLFLRSMSEFESKPIPGTEIASGVLNPVFSPDGESIAFWSSGDQTIKRIGVSGGAAVTVCQSVRPFGLSWQGDVILFGQGSLGISRVPAGGGTPEVLVKVNGGEQAHGPQLLPGGRAVLFTVATGSESDRWDKAEIVVQQLSSGERKTLLEAASDARYLPSGHVVYAVGGVLFARPFDLARLEIGSSAVPVVQGIRRADTPEVNSGVAHFAVSTTGTLIYVPGPESIVAGSRGLAFIDRKGNVEPLELPPTAYETPRVSPDGRWIAYSNSAAGEQAVYIYELSGSSAPRRLTFGGRSRVPVWSADGTRVAYQSDREGDLGVFWQRADGTDTAERLTKADARSSHLPEAFSPTGDTLLFSAFTDSHHTLWTLSLRDKKSQPFGGVTTTGTPQAVFSPDGEWVAYRATGGVYVQPFPATGALYQVVGGLGGHSPVWSSNGKEIYVAQQLRVSVASITMRPIRVGSPSFIQTPFPLVLSALSPRSFDVTPDGRLIAPVDRAAAVAGTSEARIHIVANWFEELTARVSAR